MRLRVVITGSSGYLARQLIGKLSSDPDCEYILGLDVRRGERQVRCESEWLQYDMTTPWEILTEFLRKRRINTGLHLAWQFNPIHDRKRQREVDVTGSINFFRAAAAAGLKRVVYTGSTTAYVNPRNPAEPPWVSEDTPPSGTSKYLYSKHKAEVDRVAQQFMRQRPDIQTIILRAAIVLGAHTRNIVFRMVEWPWRAFPWMFQVRGANPPMQFISEEDMADILFRAVKSEARGIFNCAGDGVLRYSEVVEAGGKRPLPLPAWLLYPSTALLWRLHLAPFPAGVLDLVRYPWVADNSRMKAEFGLPVHTSQQALESFLGGRKNA